MTIVTTVVAIGIDVGTMAEIAMVIDTAMMVTTIGVV
jgi:hypothetical protein